MRWLHGPIVASGASPVIPFITHPIAVATIVAELGLRPETVCAALFHDTGEEIVELVDRVRSPRS